MPVFLHFPKLKQMEHIEIEEIEEWQGEFEDIQDEQDDIQEEKLGKELYDYQQQDLEQLFERFDSRPHNYKLLYQLPTGGGKTVIFSEIARRYIAQKGKKVLILTHRIELCRQTSNMLNQFGVTNKVINSEVKELPDANEYMAFVAMVETLNNRLTESQIEMKDIGLVIVDEAHYNSFRKMFKFFEECFVLGVTATPLSSNIKLPMKDIYKELIVGNSISSLIDKGFLSKATIYSYDVSLGSLKIGINGDYTVASSEELYTSDDMRSKLLYAYEQRSKGKKTLIFNNGIHTSRYVYETFRAKGYDIRHLDNSHTKKEREVILKWFKEKPNAILSSVSILTTGFDEPTIETIILNRATKSLTLYFQMIGRGSRVLPNKSTFDVIDLGNNAARFGMWDGAIDWQKIFISPQYFLDNLIGDDEIERKFKYRMPPEVIALFSKSSNVVFDIEEAYKGVLTNHEKSAKVIDLAIEQHKAIVVENSEDLMTALNLIRVLKDDIEDRIRRYCYCICNSTRNYKDWAIEDYTSRLKKTILKEF